MPLTRNFKAVVAAIGAVGVLVVTSAGMAVAAYSGVSGNGTILACWKNSPGTLRIVDHFPCKTGETAISWNQKGVKGDAGAPGAAGLAGTPGANGATGATGATGSSSGVGSAGATGPAGADGAPGLPGANGKSAYELAQAAGFEGTQAEWLASLQGEAATGGGLAALGDLNGLACAVGTFPGAVQTAVDSTGGVSIRCVPTDANFRCSDYEDKLPGLDATAGTCDPATGAVTITACETGLELRRDYYGDGELACLTPRPTIRFVQVPVNDGADCLVTLSFSNYPANETMSGYLGNADTDQGQNFTVTSDATGAGTTTESVTVPNHREYVIAYDFAPYYTGRADSNC